MTHDRAVLRELAARYAEVAASADMDRRRALWRDLHALRPVRPPIYVRACAWKELREVLPEAECECHDPWLREHEDWLRYMLFRSTLGDDWVFEPYYPLRAVFTLHDSDRRWGLPLGRQRPTQAGGSYKIDPALKSPEDLQRLDSFPGTIDETATERAFTRLSETFGDALPVVVDRSPFWWRWRGDLSANLGFLRGIDHLMLDMVDRPDWLHALMGRLRDTVLASHDRAEDAGDWQAMASFNQAVPYAEETAHAALGGQPVPRKRLWAFAAAQELTLVSPAMHEEFMLAYQRPILERFRWSAYGCCEDLTNKIDMLRSIRNLRRIAVAPVADPGRCARQVGAEYVLSYRPSPAETVSCGWRPERVRERLRADLASMRGCRIDITLKDVETVERDPDRVRAWVRLAREAADAFVP